MCPMTEGSFSQRIDFGDFTKGGKRRQRTEQAPPFQRQTHSKEEQEVLFRTHEHLKNMEKAITEKLGTVILR